MSNVDECEYIAAFHPGYYIADIIADMEISPAEFATRMGTTVKTLSQLINGQVDISNDLAKKLSAAMGTSVEVWLNLQNALAGCPSLGSSSVEAALKKLGQDGTLTRLGSGRKTHYVRSDALE